MSVTARTKLYCLIGDPVCRSLSPLIMNRAFRLLGIDAVYVALRVPAPRLPEALSGLRALGVRGANVTYPHKEAVLPFIDHPSETTELVRAANTLRFVGEQVWGYNTDATGTAVALERFAGLSLEGKRAFVFGAGGAGRAAAFGLLEAGVTSVTFCVRTPAKAEAAVAAFGHRFGDASVSVVPFDGQRAADQKRAAFIESDVIINATPVGMVGAHGAPEAGDGCDGSGDCTAPPVTPTGAGAASPLIGDPEWIRKGHCCFDFVYTPRETAFLRTARARGALCLGGLSLLLAQALEGFRCWTGSAFDLETMGEALESRAGEIVFARKE